MYLCSKIKQAVPCFYAFRAIDVLTVATENGFSSLPISALNDLSLKQTLCGSGANLHRENKISPTSTFRSTGIIRYFSDEWYNCPASFYYVSAPGLVSVSSSCCYLLSSETKDRLPRFWKCIVMAELRAWMALQSSVSAIYSSYIKIKIAQLRHCPE